MKHMSRWMITAAGCLVVAALLAGYKYLQIQEAIAFGKSFPEPSETVRATMVEEGVLNNYQTTIGEIVAPQSIDLRNELEGRIVAVNFAAGDLVKKGDILVQLDVENEKAQLAAAEARAHLAELELARLQKLLLKKNVSEDRVDQAEAELKITRADMRSLQTTIDKKTLRTPFDARAGLHNLEVGEYLEGSAVVVTLVGLVDYTWVEFSLPIAEADLQVGSEVMIEAAGPDAEPVPAAIVARDPFASPSSRTVRFRGKIMGNQAFPPNAVVKVSVSSEQRRGVVLPTTALLKDGMGDYVYLLTPDSSGEGHRAHRRSVTIAYQDDDAAAISHGLASGQMVATAGAFKLRENLLVNVADGGSEEAGREVH